MKEKTPGRPGNPDPHALGIAAHVQEVVRPDITILFGSRAVGDYREDSDVDLLVITDREDHLYSRKPAVTAAKSYMRKNPPRLEVAIITMTRREFDRCRRARQHIAGQAATYGVNMSGERMDYRYDGRDDHGEHWPETRQRIQNAEEWQHQLDQMVDENHWNRKLMGLSAQQAVENALKGWLSTHNDEGRYGHEIEDAWEQINVLEGEWSDPTAQRAREAVEELLDYTRFPDPTEARPGNTNNWLTLYAAVYRYGNPNHVMDREEQGELREKVDRAVASVIGLIHERSHTTNLDVYPGGIRPWDIR